MTVSLVQTITQIILSVAVLVLVVSLITIPFRILKTLSEIRDRLPDPDIAEHKKRRDSGS